MVRQLSATGSRAWLCQQVGARRWRAEEVERKQRRDRQPNKEHGVSIAVLRLSRGATMPCARAGALNKPFERSMLRVLGSGTACRSQAAAPAPAAWAAVQPSPARLTLCARLRLMLCLRCCALLVPCMSFACSAAGGTGGEAVSTAQQLCRPGCAAQRQFLPPCALRPTAPARSSPRTR